MKIQYKVGDLMQATEPLIAHGCNAQGVMGSGVAAAIKKYYPEAFDVYRYEYETSGLVPGENVPCLTKGKWIINCITQDFYGRKEGSRYVDYTAVLCCMRNLNNWNIDIQFTSVAMPLIGAGLGGGDWSVIAPIIEEELKILQPVVYVLEKSALPVDFQKFLT